MQSLRSTGIDDRARVSAICLSTTIWIMEFDRCEPRRLTSHVSQVKWTYRQLGRKRLRISEDRETILSS